MNRRSLLKLVSLLLMPFRDIVAGPFKKIVNHDSGGKRIVRHVRVDDGILYVIYAGDLDSTWCITDIAIVGEWLVVKSSAWQKRVVSRVAMQNGKLLVEYTERDRFDESKPYGGHSTQLIPLRETAEVLSREEAGRHRKIIADMEGR